MWWGEPVSKRAQRASEASARSDSVHAIFSYSRRVMRSLAIVYKLCESYRILRTWICFAALPVVLSSRIGIGNATCSFVFLPEVCLLLVPMAIERMSKPINEIEEENRIRIK